MPWPAPEDLPDPVITPKSPALAGGFFTSSTTWEAISYYLNFPVVYSCLQRVHVLIGTFKWLSLKVEVIIARRRRELHGKVHMYEEIQPLE